VVPMVEEERGPDGPGCGGDNDDGGGGRGDGGVVPTAEEERGPDDSSRAQR
jgi:hypothetical protein